MVMILLILQGWVDELLTWDPDDYGGINRISLRANDLWTPDITVYERIGDGSARANIFDPYIIVNSSGYVKYFDLTYLTVYCRVDMILFPFDTQLCGIKFSSYSYDSEQLALVFDKSIYIKEYVFKRNGVWRLVNVDVEEVRYLYVCCPNPFVEVRFTLELQRIGNFYIYSLGLPSALLSLLLLAVFLMHPNSGEKVSLSVNNVLAFVLFQQMVVANLPMSGEDAPIVEAYFSVMITVSCLSVLASAFVLRAYHHTPEEPVPCLLRCLISRRQQTKNRGNIENHRNM
ncbi:Neuronal acetylcholine receptor subunit alpha-10 [Holothuria leucospilota]|uniref:Neuronal acetylcholine receptor subunit alpha-10 n=1 Tax=Holothuria leucospilota TaxID=206669 RepID=A0A9Q1HI65_HOLLE|nr:Neuronal acetylcholine receptor subunit alpha-10 [Holothuria leucospilota]